jgi:hypothetical protein
MNGLETVVALVLLAGILVAAIFSLVRVRRTTPEERERRRRLELSRHGRLLEALVTDCQDGVIWYTYSRSGAQYHASQDVSTLTACLPAEPSQIIGPASIKYSVRNPADSILLCEDWSGLRGKPAAGPEKFQPTGKKEYVANETIA